MSTTAVTDDGAHVEVIVEDAERKVGDLFEVIWDDGETYAYTIVRIDDAPDGSRTLHLRDRRRLERPGGRKA